MAWSTALCFSDPLSFQAAISTADLELLPTARGQFRAELTKVCMNQLWVQRCYQNLPLMIADEAAGAEYFIYFPYVSGTGSDATLRDGRLANVAGQYRRLRHNPHIDQR